ncbi:hypothetical protein KCTC52924_00694 [Arenibacter antarcticus]|uniref:Uncharacterized protein n=1 Tax=Arenibacter antarcticus TaxID=2040469 RepID=A0ABW5VBW0_9FLAO|nr:hypothetical protein [Arenibacter sp. H213]MCM4169244.1 hypothetical protein [Arenibacter sp. H213]
MSKNNTRWIFAMITVVLGFVIGIYLQDLKHQESTKAAWKANRFNVARFNKIMRYTGEMNSNNWPAMRDSIGKQLDSLMILRFRKEMDSLNAINNKGKD